MAWTTWDSYRHTGTWQRSDNDPYQRFILTVDWMFYAAAVALTITVLAVLFA